MAVPTDHPTAGPPARRRGRPPRISRDQIVAAAADVVADGGLAAITMAGVAERVGLSEMGLYRHVDTREALVVLVVDEVLGRIVDEEIVVPDRPADVRAVLIALGHQLVIGLAAHPGVAGHLAVHGPDGPHGLGVMGAVLRLLERAAVPTDLLRFAHAHYTSTVCAVAAFRERHTVAAAAPWGATAAARLRDAEWAADPALGGIAARYDGDIDAYERYAIAHGVDAVLADAPAAPRRRSR